MSCPLLLLLRLRPATGTGAVGVFPASLGGGLPVPQAANDDHAYRRRGDRDVPRGLGGRCFYRCVALKASRGLCPGLLEAQARSGSSSRSPPGRWNVPETVHRLGQRRQGGLTGTYLPTSTPGRGSPLGPSDRRRARRPGGEHAEEATQGRHQRPLRCRLRDVADASGQPVQARPTHALRGCSTRERVDRNQTPPAPGRRHRRTSRN